MKLKKLTIWIFFILLIIVLLFIFLISYQKLYGNKVLTDLWLEETNLKGLTKNEVRVILEQKISEMEKRGVKFYSEQKEITVHPVIIAISDPDLTRRVINFNIDQTIESISFFSQKISSLKFFTGEKKQKIRLVVEINQDEFLKILHSNFKEFEVQPEDAGLEYKDGNWSITLEKNGRGFNYAATITKLEENLSNFVQTPIRLETIVLKPNIYREDVTLSLKEIEKILSNAPITLFYGKDKWIVYENELKGWLILKKDDYKIFVDLDQAKIRDYLYELAAKIDQPTQESKFTMENDKAIEFQLAKEGRILEVEKSAQKIKDYIFSGFKEIGLEVVLEKPAVVNEDINKMGIIELVGKGESDFKGSPTNRIHNIKIGAKTLNGILIQPGEEFSLLKALGEVNQENGYLPELVIKGNRTIPEFGGGLCQIATSAFRVALNAGVEITQRRPHAFRVIYYEPAGVDATIYNPYPDFKFINDFPSWLLLQTRIDGTKLIFELYGTSDNRKIEISEAKIFNITAPGPAIEIETEELALGERRRVEKAVAGADTEFTRTITLPGGEPKEEIWQSHYRPWSEIWLVGKEPEPRSETTNPSESTN